MYLIWIENVVSDRFRFIRIDVLKLIGLRQILQDSNDIKNSFSSKISVNGFLLWTADLERFLVFF